LNFRSLAVQTASVSSVALAARAINQTYLNALDVVDLCLYDREKAEVEVRPLEEIQIYGVFVRRVVVQANKQRNISVVCNTTQRIRIKMLMQST